jgi:hypothetical protein
LHSPEKGEARKGKIQNVKPKILPSIPGEENQLRFQVLKVGGLRLIDKTRFLKVAFTEKGEARKGKIQNVKPKILPSIPGEENQLRFQVLKVWLEAYRYFHRWIGKSSEKIHIAKTGHEASLKKRKSLERKWKMEILKSET